MDLGDRRHQISSHRPTKQYNMGSEGKARKSAL